LYILGLVQSSSSQMDYALA